MKDFIKGLFRTVIWAAIFYGIACLVLFLLQGFVVFPGQSVNRGESPQWQGAMNIMAAQGFRGVQLDGPIEKGERITINGAWSQESEDVTQGVILWLHNRSESVTEINHQLKRLMKLDLHILAMEYRGYGPSKGAPSEEGFLADIDAVYDFLEKHDSVESDTMFIGGYSMGAALAIKAGERKDYTGIVAISPFTSLTEVLQEKFPFVPVNLLLKNKFDCMSAARSGTTPLFIAHGTRDETAPLAMAESITDAAGARCDLYTVDGADHVDIWTKGGADLIEELRDFLDNPNR